MTKEEIQNEIEHLEALWNTDIIQPKSGGLNSSLNKKLVQLRIDLKNAQ